MSWTLVKLADLFSVGSSKRVLKSQWETSGVPFYRGREITKLAIHGSVDNELFISEELFSELSQKHGVPVSGDIVITAIGTIGNSYIVKSGDRFYFKDASVLWLSKKSEVDSDFVNYWLKSYQFKSQLAKGNGATVDTLTISKLKSSEIQVPPLPEQKRIVAILDESFAGIDTAIANTEKNLANARELFESYLNSVFTQGGDRWESSILGDVYDVRDGTHDSPNHQSSGRALVTSKNLKSGSLDLSNVKCISEEDYQSICRRSAVHKGDVLLAMIGTIGNPIVVENEPDYAIKNVALFKVPKDRSGHFLRYYLMSHETVKKMAREAKGTTQKFVGLGYLRNFPIQLPDNNQEQLLVEAIAEYEGIARNLESIYQQKLTALAELKQSLLQKAFSGQLTADAAEAVDTVEAALA